MRNTTSTLFVDSRLGSSDLIIPLRKYGLDVESTRLEFGDLFWQGRGKKGNLVSIGIEFKRLEELVQALRTERLQGYQMVGMRSMYDYSYLFVEGELLYDRKGNLIKRRGRRGFVPMPGQMTVGELLKRIHVLHLCGGLNPWWTTSRKDTLQSITALYHVWTDVDLDKHRSHIGVYEAPALVPISAFRRTVRTFPHIGMRASLAVEQHFDGDLSRATMADVEEWSEIETRDDKGKSKRLGTKVATQVIKFCRGEAT